MIIDRDFENECKYYPNDGIVYAMGCNWAVVKTAKNLDKPYRMVARMGRYHFYADVDSDIEKPRYCIIGYRDM